MCSFSEADGGALIGREEAHAALMRAATAARAGQGAFVLLAGEAGIGKTSLVHHAFAPGQLLLLDGPSYEAITLPYGPLVAVLRAYRQRVPDHPPTDARLTHALALLAPDSTPTVPSPDAGRAVLFDAFRTTLAAMARRQPVAIFLDDLQWADSATLELLPALSDALACEPLLIVGAYRHDEIPRDHAIRRLRSALRRAGRLHEIALTPLDRAQTGLLVERVLGTPPGAALSGLIYERTEGLPFFVEEVALALLRLGQEPPRGTGLDRGPGEEVEMPLPESVRDAVLLRTRGLSPVARRTLEIAAVAGHEFDIDLVAALAGDEDGLAELRAHGLVVERAAGRGAFRHTLVRDACYAEVPWLRRRRLHRQVAASLDAAGAPAALVAEHWLAGHDPDHARPALLVAAEASCRVHAFRDGARAYRRALDLWSPGADAAETARLDALERLGHCASLAGDLDAAVRAWRAATEGWQRAGMSRRAAVAERRLAEIHELRGDWERALEARDAAATAFAASGDGGEAATERLLAAAHLRSAAHFHAALALLDTARSEAAQAGRLDVQARILGLEGNVRARLGQGAQGLEMVRAGLALALEHNLSGAATDIYQRLADTLEHAGDYPGAQAAYDTATAFCEAHHAPAPAHLCLACLTMVLRQTGDWARAMTVGRSVLAARDSSPHARAVASGVLGSLHVLRGQARMARPLLRQSAALASQIELAAMELDSVWGLAMLDDLTGAYAPGLARCRALLDRWERTEERHYVVAALRWAATFCAEQDAADEARACAAALARIATATGQADALAALAHALGETTLLDGDAAGAAAQFDQALALLRERPLPFERAQSARRAGLALLRAGQRDAGIDRLVTAYRVARHLGARPLAMRVAQDLAAEGEPVERRLSRRAGGQLRNGGLSRREVEVLRLVAVGNTSREIGAALFLSPRTVEMHVDHVLTKLDCRTRAEAARKATTLGLLE